MKWLSLGEMERDPEIKKWQRKIDKLDIKIVKLLNRRARYAREIGKIKREKNLHIYSPEQETRVFQNITKHNYGPLSDIAIKRLYERIIDESIRFEKEASTVEKSEQIKRIEISEISKKFMPLIFLLFLYILNALFLCANHPPTKLVVIDIPHNASFKQVAEILDSQGILRSKIAFYYFVKVFNLDREVKSGKYIFSDNLPMALIIKEIVSPSRAVYVSVTIPEGITAKKIASIFKAKLGIDSLKFMQLVNDPSFAHKLGIEASNLEGYLMPDTYVFSWGDREENIISKMVSEFKKFYTDSLKKKEKKVGLNTHQVVTLASIVEGEAKFDDEKPRIAGVYFNRLKRKMPLEADPTIQYIIPDGPRRLFYKDLKIQSPYNTYLNPGLPPGPVNNPSRSSILAVLNYEKNNFLYFVSDGSGRHIFSRTYNDHLKAVRRYRKILAERNLR